MGIQTMVRSAVRECCRSAAGAHMQWRGWASDAQPERAHMPSKRHLPSCIPIQEFVARSWTGLKFVASS